MGKQGAAEVESTIGIVTQPPGIEAYVQGLGREVAEHTEQPDLPWSFAVVDDAGVNAFALPGGKIFVTRGLLARLSNAAQLSTVLGHECGHVTARHSAEQMSKAQLAELGLGASAIFIEQTRELIPLASAGLSLLFLKFSRDDEYQADELGVRYSSRAGFDVREMPEVFMTLERASKDSEGAKLPEWLSTHPSSENRIGRVKDEIARSGRARRTGHRPQAVPARGEGARLRPRPAPGLLRRRPLHPSRPALRVLGPRGLGAPELSRRRDRREPRRRRDRAADRGPDRRSGGGAGQVRGAEGVRIGPAGRPGTRAELGLRAL